MQVTINGEEKEIPDGLTVTGLLGHLGIHPGRVAIERNLEILFRAKWENTLVQPGDRYEIVNFVGGG
ncbi:MAG: sulfur carrier protein ThiS [Acidobacteria bacterium]|nr:sulfur carrier protein ThiS [Acidobacteriota bacterium]MBI3662489.1 sulfur carrier protein ThiS [Acidobacteriota bacterium]